MRDWLTNRPYITRQSWPSGGLDFWPAGRQTTHPRLIVLHSTETTGFPGYNGGAAAPHFTIDLVSGAVADRVAEERGYQVTVPALAAGVARWLGKDMSRAWLAALVAGCWIVAEWLRSWVFTGYAWNPFAMVLLGPFDRPGLKPQICSHVFGRHAG